MEFTYFPRTFTRGHPEKEGCYAFIIWCYDSYTMCVADVIQYKTKEDKDPNDEDYRPSGLYVLDDAECPSMWTFDEYGIVGYFPLPDVSKFDLETHVGELEDYGIAYEQYMQRWKAFPHNRPIEKTSQQVEVFNYEGHSVFRQFGYLKDGKWLDRNEEEIVIPEGGHLFFRRWIKDYEE